MKLTTRPNSTTEFDIEFPGGIQGVIVRRVSGHRDTWTLLVNKKGSKAGSTTPSDILHGMNANNFEVAFFRAMTITSDEIEGWEEENRAEFAEVDENCRVS